MLNETIEDQELLFRAIPNKPQMWKTAENRPSSAIFKDSKGVSVDRSGGRRDAEVVQIQLERFDNLKAVAAISALDCRNCGAFPKYDPIPNNEFHSLILDAPNSVTIKSGKARRLAKMAKVVFQQAE